MKTLDINYPYLGHRSYADGPSMLDGLLRCARIFNPAVGKEPTTIKLFKIIKGFDTLSTAVALSHQEAQKHPRLKEAVARLDLDVAGERITSLLFQRTDAAITERNAEYDARNYVANISMSDSGASTGRMKHIVSFIDLIRGIDECNRQATVARIAPPAMAPSVRWAYITDLRLFSDEESRSISNVAFTFMNEVILGTHRFEIKKGRFSEHGPALDFTICFFMRLPD